MAIESGAEGLNKPQPQQTGLSNDQLQDLVLKLSKQVEQLSAQKATQTSGGLTAADVATIMSAVRTQGDIDYTSGITTEQVPEDDYDEQGVRFCAPFSGYAIIDDIRKGHVVKLPYGKKSILFKYQSTRRYQQGKYEAISPFSTYTSHSKKEIEWLRASSKYGIYFYENSNSVASSDLRKIQKLSRVMTILSGFDTVDLIKRAKEYGVSYTEDPRDMRLELAHKMVESELESERERTKGVLDQNYKERLVVGKE